MSKVPCTKCGVSILQTTALRNGGLCVPCKSGKRESMGAAKQWYEAERERERTDPFRKLWSELVHRAYESHEGFAGFSEVEKQYFAVGLLNGEVYNGGFDQYFFNSSGSHYIYALAGLKAMGAIKSHTLLQRAKQVLFDFKEVPENTEKRRMLLRQRASDSRAKRLEELDEQYWEDPDGLSFRIEEFARKNGLV